MNLSSNEARLAARLQELRGEYARGEAQLAELDQRRTALRDTLLRISGAMQVLQEMLDQHPTSPGSVPGQIPPEPVAQGIPAGLDASLPVASR